VPYRLAARSVARLTRRVLDRMELPLMRWRPVD
jgi:hypothetical protein